MDHLTSDTVEYICRLELGEALICTGCLAIAWGAMLMVLI